MPQLLKNSQESINRDLPYLAPVIPKMGQYLFGNNLILGICSIDILKPYFTKPHITQPDLTKPQCLPYRTLPNLTKPRPNVPHQTRPDLSACLT